MSEQDQTEDFEALLQFIRRSRGFDFTGYKRTTLTRRFVKRMQTLGLERFSDYQDHLQVYPEEFVYLFNTILINVTSFYRDRPAWEALASEIVPRILDSKTGGEPLRVWSAGCSSGEEAYTLAMLFAEALGEEQFRERVKIYATDVDDEALNTARQANYSLGEVSGVPPAQLERSFERVNDRFVFRKELRRSVIFGRHDLMQDAPISRIDLIVCRNTLMYFNADAQARILSRFHFALNEIGYLFLGKAEMLFTHTNLFTPANGRCRIFTKVSRVNLRDRLAMLTQGGADEGINHVARHVRFRETIFEVSPVAQMAVDANGFLVLLNERARALFNLTHQAIGRSLHDLDFFYRLPQLRPALEQARVERKPINLDIVEWPTSLGDLHYLSVQVTPLVDVSGLALGVNITCVDLTQQRRLQDELEHANQELETASEELQSANEELETTNEELQSMVEELETTNEELQATNEELETMNEELQSTNEELETINEELRGRTEELNHVNNFLESILANLTSAVLVLDRDLVVQVWSRKAEDLWGLRAEEARGRGLASLDIGLPLGDLLQPMRAVLSGEADQHEATLLAVNRRGRPIRCQITVKPLNDTRSESRGLILLMDDEPSPDGTMSISHADHDGGGKTRS